MHLRRALLLFAIVIGLAALAASISQPADDGDPTPSTSTDRAQRPETAPTTETEPKPADEPREPTAGAGTAPAGVEPESIELAASDQDSVRVPTEVPVSLSVAVVSAGRVDIPSLGLTAAAEPLTPARFDLLLLEPGRYELRFTGADAEKSVAAGTLVAVDAER